MLLNEVKAMQAKLLHVYIYIDCHVLALKASQKHIRLTSGLDDNILPSKHGLSTQVITRIHFIPSPEYPLGQGSH